MRTVFIGYAPADYEKCQQIAVVLRERGFTVRYEEYPANFEGRTLSTRIIQELRAYSAFVLLLSPASVASGLNPSDRTEIEVNFSEIAYTTQKRRRDDAKTSP